MAPGLKVGDCVKAKPTVIFGCRRAGDIFGPWASERDVVSQEEEEQEVERLDEEAVKRSRALG